LHRLEQHAAQLSCGADLDQLTIHAEFAALSAGISYGGFSGEKRPPPSDKPNRPGGARGS
jgi:hypothetical protein